jgi:hypothetical protein
MADDEVWRPENPDDGIWNEMFSDEIDRERWRTNFGKDGDAAETASYWRDMLPGIEPSVAAIYHKNGLNVYDVSDYQNGGIQDYKEVLGWHRVKATPEVATAFKEKGIDPDTYDKWAKIGVNDPDTMIRFSEDFKIDLKNLEQFVKPLVDKELIELKEVPKWLEAGVDVRELESWLNAGFKYPSIVKAWKQLRMKPEDAKEWERVVHYPRDAAQWLAGGYKDVKDVEGLIKQGYASPEEIAAEAENLVMKV